MRRVQQTIYVAESSRGFYFLKHENLFCAEVVILTFKATLLRDTMCKNVRPQRVILILVLRRGGNFNFQGNVVARHDVQKCPPSKGYFNTYICMTSPLSPR